MKSTSRVPILVLVAVPLPRFVRPSLMLLVVEVMVESSSPVCSLSAACNELTSPDSTAVFSLSNLAGRHHPVADQVPVGYIRQLPR